MSIGKRNIPEPKKKHRISNSEMLLGLKITPLERLQQIDEDTYEQIVLCWAKGHVERKYETALLMGGPGDKGRDVCAYHDYKNDSFDLYQCKHYSKKLSYSDVRLEFGKLLYYTYNKDYSKPQKYYFVSPRGISSSLNDLLKDKKKLYEKLISEWDIKISEEISKTFKVKLTNELKKYIEEFDYSIIYSLEPLDFLEQFETTIYYPIYFGGGLKKSRSEKLEISKEIAEREINYVNQLFSAYKDYKKIDITSINDFDTDKELNDHFNRSRNCFYMAETLAQFSRDNIPSEIDAFEELKDEVFEQVIDVYNKKHENGYVRLNATTESAKNGSYHSNPLFPELKAQDKTGICHHLANEHKLKWMK